MWRCILYPHLVREELVREMAEAGWVEVSLGFESGSQEVLREMNKRFTPQDVRTASDLLARHGIRRIGCARDKAPSPLAVPARCENPALRASGRCRPAFEPRATLHGMEARGTADPVALEFAQRVRARLGSRVRQVVLFGSRARGEAREDSDYDVVVDRRGPDVRAALLEIEVELMDRHGSLVACLLRDEQEWAASQRLPLGLNVAREGVPL